MKPDGQSASSVQPLAQWHVPGESMEQKPCGVPEQSASVVQPPVLFGQVKSVRGTLLGQASTALRWPQLPSHRS